MRTFSALRVGALLAAFGCAGCGADGPPPTYPAGGSVSSGGKPAQRVVVTLVPVDARKPPLAAYPRGESGADGRFTLTTFSPGDGAPAGEYKVTLRWPAILTGKVKALAEAQGDGDADRLNGKFTDPAASAWPVTIRPGDNALPALTVPER